MICRVFPSDQKQDRIHRQHTDCLAALMDTFVILFFLLSSAASGLIVLRPQPGEDVTLPCWAGDVSIRAVEWTRADLESPEYVLFYRDGGSVTNYQHSSFEGRVQLVDGELKDGNVSLILKNVSGNDSGTYKCRVAVGSSGRNERATMKTISSIRLEVMDSEISADGNHSRVGLGAGVGLVSLVVVGLFLVWIYKRHQDETPEASAADEAESDQL